MRPAPFALEEPESLAEAVALFDRRDGEALLLAGGQTLIPLLNMRIVRPDRVIDLGRVSGLDGITANGDEVAIGAMTRQALLESSPVMLEAAPLVRHVAPFVGQVQTRSRGTLGGSISLGSSVGELCVTLLALGGRVRVDRLGGFRWIEAANFFTDYLTTALEPGEILTEVRFPAIKGSTRWGFSELKLRACDFPIVVAVAVLEFDGDTCVDARIAMGGVAPTPARIAAAEGELVGSRLSDDDIRRAVSTIEGSVSPADDLHAPATYRRRIAGGQVANALEMAGMRGGVL